MRIGLVLAKTPAYSETFFMSKIKGLQTSGFSVTLLVQEQHPDFNLCPVIVAPKLYKRHLLKQFLITIGVLVKGLRFYRRFNHFLRLEKQAGRTFKQSLKNAYTNAHILMAQLDWVHFGFATMALQSEHVAKAIGAKMGVSFRGFDIDVYPLKYPNCYDLLWQNVDKIHSISNYLLQKAYTLGLSKRVPYQIITPAIDVSLFNEKSLSKHNSVRFVTVARLHWIKGLQATLEALALLKAKGVDFTYRIIGEGPDYEALMFAIYQLGLKEQVELVGKQSHENTLHMLAQSDIYLQYSYSEGFCNAVLEAQTMGLLCVVSDGGALPENVVHGETGWVVPRRNTKLLAETIIQVINLNDKEKKRICQQARDRMMKQFSLKNQQEAFNKFYIEFTS